MLYQLFQSTNRDWNLFIDFAKMKSKVDFSRVWNHSAKIQKEYYNVIYPILYQHYFNAHFSMFACVGQNFLQMDALPDTNLHLFPSKVILCHSQTCIYRIQEMNDICLQSLEVRTRRHKQPHACVCVCEHVHMCTCECMHVCVHVYDIYVLIEKSSLKINIRKHK